MKKILIAVFALILCGAAVGAFAQCATNYSYTNGAVAGAYWTGYTNDPAAGGIQGVAYVIGKGNPAVGAGSGTDSGIYPMTLSGCAGAAACQARLISGNFRLAASTAQAANAWDTCPVQGADNLTVIMWESTNGGAAGHTGKFCAATAQYVSTSWAFSAAMTPQNGKVFQTIPAVNVVSSTLVDATHRTFVLRIPVPTEFPTQTNTAFKRQYYASAIATPPVVVTGWNLYWAQAASAPATAATSGWNLLATVPIPDDGNAYVEYTAANFAMGSNPTYWAVAPVFADGFTPFTTYGNPYSGFFVGQNSEATNPTAAPVFANVVADATTATWTSGVETGVVSYQTFWAPTLTNAFQPAGQPVTARGDNQSYSATYRILTTAKSFYVKVKALKADGSFEWSAPVLVNRIAKVDGGLTRPERKR